MDSPYPETQQSEQQLGLNAPYPPPVQQAPPPQPPAPAFEPPWTPQDETKFASLQADRRQAEDDLAAGEVMPQTHQQYLRRIDPLLAQMQRRQKAAQQTAQQTAKTQLMDQTALQEAIRAQHQIARAKSFPQTVAALTDALTGFTAHFVQDDKGNWKEVKYENEQARADRAAQDLGGLAEGLDTAGLPEGFAKQLPEFRQQPTESIAHPELQPLDNRVPDLSGIQPTDDEPYQEQKRGPRILNLSAPPDYDFSKFGKQGILFNLTDERANEGAPRPVETLQQVAARVTGKPDYSGYPAPKVLNAAGEDITRQQQEQYDRWKKTGSWQPEETGTGAVLSARQLQSIFQRAQQAVPKPANWNDPHQVLHYQEGVQALAARIIQNHYDSQGHEGKLKLLEKRHEMTIEGINERNKQTLERMKEFYDHKVKMAHEQPKHEVLSAAYGAAEKAVDHAHELELKNALTPEAAEKINARYTPQAKQKMIEARYQHRLQTMGLHQLLPVSTGNGPGKGNGGGETNGGGNKGPTDQAKDELNQLFAGNQAQKIDLEGESSVSAERAKELAGLIQSIGPLPKNVFGFTSLSGNKLGTKLGNMHALLQKAVRENRPLKKSEADQYQALHHEIGTWIDKNAPEDTKAGHRALALKSDLHRIKTEKAWEDEKAPRRPWWRLGWAENAANAE